MLSYLMKISFEENLVGDTLYINHVSFFLSLKGVFNFF